MFSWTGGYVDNVANLKREFALVSGFGSETVFIRVQVDREREFLSMYQLIPWDGRRADSSKGVRFLAYTYVYSSR